MIKHIVTWKLQAEDAAAKATAFAEIAEALGALPALIPEIASFQIGADLGATDGNWDVTLITNFETAEGLAIYQGHPEHVKAAQVTKARVSDRATVDFEY